MSHTLGSYFSIGLIQPGTIGKARHGFYRKKKTQGGGRMREEERENEYSDWKERGKKNVHSRENESPSALPEIGRPTSSTVLLATARPSQSEAGERVVTSSVVGVIK